MKAKGIRKCCKFYSNFCHPHEHHSSICQHKAYFYLTLALFCHALMYLVFIFYILYIFLLWVPTMHLPLWVLRCFISRSNYFIMQRQNLTCVIHCNWPWDSSLQWEKLDPQRSRSCSLRSETYSVELHNPSRSLTQNPNPEHGPNRTEFATLCFCLLAPDLS